MKKLFCLLLALCLLLSVGCTAPQGGGESSEMPTDSGSGESDPPDTPDEWHLSGEPEEELYISYSDYGIEIPEVKYDETINDIRFELDFFESYYPAGSLMQYQLTVTNNTGADLGYDGSFAVATLSPEGGSGTAEPLRFRMINPPGVEYNPEYDSSYFPFPAGKSEVFQGYLRVDEQFFETGSYLFRVTLVDMSKNPADMYASFSCPLSVVYGEFEVVEEELPTWHLSTWKKPTEAVNRPYISYNEYGIEIPETKYDETVNGFRFELDLFENFYPAGSLMQYRLKITNNTGVTVSYREPAAVGVLTRGTESFGFTTVTPKGMTYEGDSDAPPKEFLAGETLVYEGCMRVGSEFFNVLSYRFRISLIDSDANATEHASFSCQVNSVYRGKVVTETVVPPGLYEPKFDEPAVGHYYFKDDDIAAYVDFWIVPNPWYGERIVGTLTYINNTGTEISCYLHAYVDFVDYRDGAELIGITSSPRIEPSEKYQSVTEEAPISLMLLPEEMVTVNFSVEVPADIYENDAIYSLVLGLYESENRVDGTVVRPIKLRVH